MNRFIGLRSYLHRCDPALGKRIDNIVDAAQDLPSHLPWPEGVTATPSLVHGNVFVLRRTDGSPGSCSVSGSTEGARVAWQIDIDEEGRVLARPSHTSHAAGQEDWKFMTRVREILGTPRIIGGVGEEVLHYTTHDSLRGAVVFERVLLGLRSDVLRWRRKVALELLESTV